MPSSQRPRAFISYSHDSSAHRQRVLALAQALRNNGIDVELDQFHEAEIVDWPRWCNEHISRAASDFVPCVCTAEYNARIEGRVPPGKGKGVYWEGSLIDDELYDEKGNSRFIPILFDDEPGSSIPRIFRGWTYCRLRDCALSDAGYNNLVRILTGQARAEKNALGPIPVLPPEAPAAQPSAPPSRIAPTRLRHGADHLVGREKELAALDIVWSDSTKHVLAVVAWGGVGKTALIVDWTARLAQRDYDGARYFDWSFYSQGTREQGNASADTFIAAALKFFGGNEGAKLANGPTSPYDKATRLAEMIGAERTLLILDGLEPLQYPPGTLEGQLKDPAVEVLLHALAQQNSGLCVVTTRESVADLAPFRETTAPEWNLEHLTDEAGAALLHQAGVRRVGAAEINPDDSELFAATREISGHALTLNLLGRYLAKAHGGDIRKRDLVKFEKADAKVQGGHAFKVMAAYERWLSAPGEDSQRQLAILRLLGLFDRPADAACLAALRKEPAIKGLTEPLVDLPEEDWNLAISALEDCRLVSRGDPRASPSQISDFKFPLDCHPLIREYFAHQLRAHNPDAWRSAHERLFYLTSAAGIPDQPALDDLQPIYQSIYHGCQAGLHRLALTTFRLARIYRDTGCYTYKELGAPGADLSAAWCFFDGSWDRPSPNLSRADTAWLQQLAAFFLSALARASDAIEVIRAALPAVLDQPDWDDAASGASMLSRYELQLGDIRGGLRDAHLAVEYGDRTRNTFSMIANRALLADVQHQSGDSAGALAIFRDAERAQSRRQPELPLLYSRSGYCFHDLLLQRPDRVAWQRMLRPKPEPTARLPNYVRLLDVCAEVHRRAAQILPISQEVGYPEDTALDHLALARALLCRAVLSAVASDRRSAIKSSRQHLQDGLRDFRRAAHHDDLPRILLSTAWLSVLESDSASAQVDLDEAWHIASRGPMRLHLADIHLHRARLFLRADPYPWNQHPDGRPRGPADDLAAARKLIEECGYNRRLEELEDAERAAALR